MLATHITISADIHHRLVVSPMVVILRMPPAQILWSYIENDTFMKIYSPNKSWIVRVIIINAGNKQLVRWRRPFVVRPHQFSLRARFSELSIKTRKPASSSELALPVKNNLSTSPKLLVGTQIYAHQTIQSPLLHHVSKFWGNRTSIYRDISPNTEHGQATVSVQI